MLHTDVVSYYPSVGRELLGEVLEDLGCPRSLTFVVEKCLLWWQIEHGLVGLPIGPEGSGVLGTAFLEPVDDLLSTNAPGYFRYTDDVFVLADGHQASTDSIRTFEAGLAGLVLRRNVDKTEVRDADQARATWFGRSPVGAPYGDEGGDIALSEDRAVEIIRQELQSHDPDQNRFRYALGALRRPQNRDVVSDVLGSTWALEQSPRHVAKYLLAVRPVGEALVGRMVDDLRGGMELRTQARDLQLIRVSRGEPMGRVEGGALLDVATCPRRPAPVRAWALDRAAECGAVKISELADIALDRSESSFVRRGAIAAARHVPNTTQRSFLRHRTLLTTSMVWTAEWVAAQRN